MNYEIIQGDCIQTMKGLPAGSVQTCVTSPPYYGLRDYQVEGQIGLEETPEMYVAKLVDVFREVRRVLRDDATLWLNLGDSYAANRPGGQPAPTNTGNRTGYLASGTQGIARVPDGLKPKDLIGIPWLVAFALRADGWWLRSDIIWAKKNCMPESVMDRPTRSHEYIFLLSKSSKYFYDTDAIREPYNESSLGRYKYEFGKGSAAAIAKSPAVGNGDGHNADPNPSGRNKRSVWFVSTKSYSGAHFATFPPDLIEPCILAGSKAGDTVLDPFNGSGTTGAVALKHGRKYIGCELNPDYIELAHDRIRRSQPMLLEVTA